MEPLRRYAAEAGVAPKGLALVQVLQEPVAVGLLEALAVCHNQTGDAPCPQRTG
jgi:hypothetical protein